MKRVIDERPTTLGEDPEGWVLLEQDGKYAIEKAQVEREGPFYPWSKVHLYRADVPEDVYKEHDWAAKGLSDDDLADGRDPDPIKRAHTLYWLGENNGWIELDHYPLHLSLSELAKRWEIEDDVEVPDEGSPQERVVRFLFQALRLAYKEPGVGFGRAVAKAMARVRRTEGGTRLGSWGYTQIASMLKAIDGRLGDTERMALIAVDIKALKAIGSDLTVTHESEDE